MAKTQKELTELKVEYEELSTKLKELSEDELKYVTGGIDNNGKFNVENHVVSDSAIPAPTYDESFNKDVKPKSTKGWFGDI